MINGHWSVLTSISAFPPHRRDPSLTLKELNLVRTVSAKAALTWRGPTACWHATSVTVPLAQQRSKRHSWLAVASLGLGGPGQRWFTWLSGRGQAKALGAWHKTLPTFYSENQMELVRFFSFLSLLYFSNGNKTCLAGWFSRLRVTICMTCPTHWRWAFLKSHLYYLMRCSQENSLILTLTLLCELLWVPGMSSHYFANDYESFSHSLIQMSFIFPFRKAAVCLPSIETKEDK